MAHSMGADFIFFPEDIVKSSGRRREPADMVWACNNCIILMGMTNTVGSAEMMFEHNMKNLKGWLKRWKSGDRLRGKSLFTTYDIGFDDYKHKVLVSVVEGPHAVAQWHDEMKTELRKAGREVTACVTVPEKVLHYLAQNGGSTRDLLEFVESVRKEGKSIMAADALEMVRYQHEMAFASAGAADICPDYETDQLLKQIVRSYRSLKSGQDEQLKVLTPVLNDLNWTELIGMLYMLRAAQRRILDVPIGETGPRTINMVYNRPPYTFLLSAMAMFNSCTGDHVKKFGEVLGHVKRKYEDTCKVFITLHILDNEGTTSIIYAIDPMPVKSYTERLLESWT